MDRREFIAAAGATTALGLAGCSDTTDLTPTNSVGAPEWVHSIPATKADERTAASRLDISAIKSSFSEEQTAGLDPDQFGPTSSAADPEIERAVVVTRPKGSEEADTIATGAFDPDAISTGQGIDDERVETYKGFDVLAVDSDAVQNVAVSETKYIRSTEPTVYVDAIQDDTTRLTEADETIALALSRVEGPVTAFHPRRQVTEDAALDPEPLVAGSCILPTDGAAALIAIYFLYESTDDATDAAEQDWDAFRDSLDETNASTIISVSQDGSFVVVKAEPDTLDF